MAHDMATKTWVWWVQGYACEQKHWDADEVLQGMIENDVVDYGMEGHVQLEYCECIKYVLWCYGLGGDGLGHK